MRGDQLKEDLGGGGLRVDVTERSSSVRADSYRLVRDVPVRHDYGTRQ